MDDQSLCLLVPFWWYCLVVVSIDSQLNWIYILHTGRRQNEINSWYRISTVLVLELPERTTDCLFKYLQAYQSSGGVSSSLGWPLAACNTVSHIRRSKKSARRCYTFVFSFTLWRCPRDWEMRVSILLSAWWHKGIVVVVVVRRCVLVVVVVVGASSQRSSAPLEIWSSIAMLTQLIAGRRQRYIDGHDFEL